jgi:hypothetical protein
MEGLEAASPPKRQQAASGIPEILPPDLTPTYRGLRPTETSTTMTPILRWRIYLACLVGEFLALALCALFGLSLIEPLVLGDAHVKVSPLWILIARSKPLLFSTLGCAGLALFILLEVLRRWLRRRWERDVYIGENL